MKKLLLAGYFGCGNLGDDAMMLGLMQGLQGEPVQVTALSGNPFETNRLYGVSAIPRKDVAQVKAAIAECDALVFAGGSIFQDVTSLRSVAYYSGLSKWAKAGRKKVIMLSQGVGPLNRILGKSMASKAFGMADLVSVRDQASAVALKSLGYRGEPRLTGDLAFLLPKPALDPNVQSFQVGEMRSVGLAPRPYGKGDQVVRVFGELARLLYRSNSMPVLIEMDQTEDGPLIDAISKTQGGKIPSLRKLGTPMQLQQRLARVDGVIAMRLHAGILSVTVGVPPYMVSYDPKVNAFANALGLPSPPSIKDASAERIFEGFQESMRDKDRHAATLERKRAEQEQAARASVELLMDCVGR